MEGDPAALAASKGVTDFYPRPHMEGDGKREPKHAEVVVNFYPRPHMEGDSKV